MSATILLHVTHGAATDLVYVQLASIPPSFTRITITYEDRTDQNAAPRAAARRPHHGTR